ncbi:uncharacterized protein LOC112569560 [Pomacea canaliculata]|uniref:uncharacterized protein LOC112569560 n=1 Tax=Pomacea canaliculata TaxID=400727 RepID=UPI000D733D98|nr:uncharacterized protein LOC112569560 [Pomacea canaliculata]
MIETRNKEYLFQLCVFGLLLTSVGGIQLFQATTYNSHHSFFDIQPVANDTVMVTVTYRSCEEISFSIRSGNTFLKISMTKYYMYAKLLLLKPGQPLSTLHPENRKEFSYSPELISAFGHGISCNKDRTVMVVWKKSGRREMSIFMQPSIIKSSSFFVGAFKGDVEAIHVESNRSHATWNLTVGVPEINQYLISAVNETARFYDSRIFPPSTTKSLFFPALAKDSAIMMVMVSYRSCKHLYMDITAGVSLIRVKVLHSRLFVEYWDLIYDFPMKKMYTRNQTINYATGTSCTSDRSIIITWTRFISREMTVTMLPPILAYDMYIVPGFLFFPRTIDLFPLGGESVNWTVSVAHIDKH